MKGTWCENVLKEKVYIYVQTGALVHVNGILLIIPSIFYKISVPVACLQTA